MHEQASVQAGNLLCEEYLLLLTDLKEDFAGTLDEHAEITSSGVVETIERPERSEPEHLARIIHEPLRRRIASSAWFR
ncbi:MAG: hypothetical protein JSV80_00400 [Acidobacteriota bacterium]|nr:MAG: hypothetical protein JSV80_00400 [Acidobacteriota bacterium]